MGIPNRFIRDMVSDQIKTPNTGWVNCQDVCVAPHAAWTSRKTSCSLTVDWQELKQAAKDDLGVDLKGDLNGLAGNKDENMEAAMAIVEQMKAQFGLSGSNEEIGRNIESQAWEMTDDELGAKARGHMETAMSNNKKMTEWVKTNAVA